MRLLVGLGNPGDRYRRTRHNVGFMVADELAARSGVTRWREEADAWIAEARVGGEDALLVKPATFMNRSGVAVERVLAGRGIGLSDLAVVLDDVALELGTLRVRERGTHGGHNGLRSLIEMLGSDEFARVRVGIRKDEVHEDLAEYVLSEFPEEDVLVVQEMVGLAGDAVECLFHEGAAEAMNRFNGARREPG
ncbi:MAG TPA: aminoacyl-tRNA hydrolase [Vicinamibacteria bacterium]|nr:aminoacyl-tRNA hydrolase [Vicinamibacteria bacterium]